MIAQEYFEEPAGSILTAARRKARSTQPITYDCMAGKVAGDRVGCSEGHVLKSPGRGSNGTLSLLSVLRGRSSSTCRDCNGYDGETADG